MKFYLMIVCTIIFIEGTSFSCFDPHFENRFAENHTIFMELSLYFLILLTLSERWLLSKTYLDRKIIFSLNKIRI